jgi:hypothetical protein
LKEGKTVILLGDYGTGKSRCIKELFFFLSDTTASKQVFPIAIDLRENWGLNSASEIIRRHFQDLGLDNLSGNVVRAYRRIPFCFLLDGFDEIGSQSWSETPNKLSIVRKKSLEGVKHLVQSSNHGILIAGRKHYFNTNAEMHEALGTSSDNVEIIQCYDQFTEQEMSLFIEKVCSKTLDLPKWLPRRPLVCQVVVEFEPDTITRLFSSEDNIADFWNLFITAVTTRESTIRSALDSTSIRSILKRIARFTRIKVGEVGPVTQTEINLAFEKIVGTPPIGESAIVLQRLPGLGRFKVESDDRQFIDMFILDGLRAEDLIDSVNSFDKSIFDENWKNPLRNMGLQIVSKEISGTHTSRASHYLAYLKETTTIKNRILSSDIIASLITACEKGKCVIFSNYHLTDGHIVNLDFSGGIPSNITFEECIVEELTLPVTNPENVKLIKCTINQLLGISSGASLPGWMKGCQIENFEVVDTVSMIRKANLSVPQQIFITILRKTFFQRGAGRKEEALLRGLGNIDKHGYTRKILNLLLSKGILYTSKGKEGPVYHPTRSHVGRMQKILSNLRHSDDKLWKQISDFEQST